MLVDWLIVVHIIFAQWAKSVNFSGSVDIANLPHVLLDSGDTDVSLVEEDVLND